MTTATTFATWLHDLDALSVTHGALTHTDEQELRVAFDLGFTPLEAYLWHVCAPELPDGDIYLDA
jgi:hypothetical protein